MGGSTVDEVLSWPPQNAFRVVINGARKRVVVEVNQIISHVGFRPDNSIYQQLQVHECYATSGPIKLAASLLVDSGDCLVQAPPGIESLKNPEPDFFIIGNKSYGTNSSFLIRQGIDQVKLIVDHLADRLKINRTLNTL